MPHANYIIKKEVTGSKKVYNIFELGTEQVISSFETYEDARKNVKKFNTRGFCGWTPSFVLTKFNAPGLVKGTEV